MPKAKEQRSVNLIPLRQTQNDYQILASQNTRAISGLASSSQKHERRLERTTETLAKVSYPLLPYLHCVQNLAIPSNERSTPPIYASCPYDQASLDQHKHILLLSICPHRLQSFSVTAGFQLPMAMATRGRLCTLTALLLAAVLAAPAASVADAPWTGAGRQRQHLAPAQAPVGRTSAMPPTKAPHLAPSPKAGSPGPFPPEAPAQAPSPASPGDGATVPSSGATEPGTATSTLPVITAMIAPSEHSSIAAPAASSSWTAAFSVAGGVALMLLRGY